MDILFSLLLSLSMIIHADGCGSNCFVLGQGSIHRKPRVPSCRRICSSAASMKFNAKADDGTKLNENNEEDAKYLKSLGRRERKRILQRREHERRKNAWLARYGSAAALQQTFGTTGQHNNDRTLSPTQTRALYHALLPRSLLALSELGVLDPSDLAPLAYQAR